jgi:hypothetical protein
VTIRDETAEVQDAADGLLDASGDPAGYARREYRGGNGRDEDDDRQVLYGHVATVTFRGFAKERIHVG